MAILAGNQWVSNLSGLSLAIVLASIILGVTSLVIVLLRFYLRIKEGSFGWDDSLMAIGLLLFLADVALACAGAYRGIGKYNAQLNNYLKLESVKYLVIWMMVYFHALLFIKCSVCTTLYRIASPNKVYRNMIWILFAIVIANYLTTFVGVLTLCHPLSGKPAEETYREGRVVCTGLNAMVGLLYTSTACSIATDVACAVLPGVVLWRTEAKLKTKIGATILLSFGSLASITTVLRIPHIEAYRHPTEDLVAHVGNIILWSNVESAIGIIAGSIPSLRRLVLNRVNKLLAEEQKARQLELALETFKSLRLPARFSRNLSFLTLNTERCISVATVHPHGESDWKRLRDDPDQEENIGIAKSVNLSVLESFSPIAPSFKSQAKHRSLHPTFLYIMNNKILMTL